MEFNLTNEEIVYLYNQIQSYRAIIDKQYNKELPFMQKHLELYSEFLKENDSAGNEKQNEIISLQKKMVEDLLPKSLLTRLDFVSGLLDKFKSVYEMIEESDPGLIETVNKTYISFPEEVSEISEQLNNKFYGKQDLF